MSREFKTTEVLASMHVFPGIIAASENNGPIPQGSVIKALDRLAELAGDLAGVGDSKRLGQMGWSFASQALRPALKDALPDLAAEPIPDGEYWKGSHRTIDPDKASNLAKWCVDMETKYGKTIKVPDIRASVEANVEASLNSDGGSGHFGDKIKASPRDFGID